MDDRNLWRGLMDYISRDPRLAALAADSSSEKTSAVDPRIAWYRAGANADEGMGFNALMRATGLNLSPRASASQVVQPELPPQNRISETFRQIPGQY